jgi:hypothetical protein
MKKGPKIRIPERVKIEPKQTKNQKIEIVTNA